MWSVVIVSPSLAKILFPLPSKNSVIDDELMKNESCYYEMVNKQNELEMIREVC